MKDFTKEQNKLRGGYYTPSAISKFLVSWVLKSSNQINVLEPSMGDGAFLDSINGYLDSNPEARVSFTGVELFESEYLKAKSKIKKYKNSAFKLVNNDFFEEYCALDKFDAVIGNPPFIRYQSFPEEHRSKATKILNDAGFNPNKMTNAWAFFLLASISLLKKNGRIAMVIPAELLQVKYAQEAREFISKHFTKATIISFEELVFDGIQQEVVLLLAEKSDESSTGIDLIEIRNEKDLPDLLNQIDNDSHFKPVQHNTDKWTQYFLSHKEIELLKRLKDYDSLIPLGKILDVDVGVVTGNNKFFVVDKDTIQKYDLKKYVKNLVGKSKQLNGGIVFYSEDWEANLEKGYPMYLLDLEGKDVNQHHGLKRYIDKGVQDEVNKGYKCRIRKNWYVVPSIWIPEMLMLRQIHDYPRFIYNEAKAIPTDTIHRVKVFDGLDPQIISTTFLNSISFAYTEVLGRSYGGGVLEIEPNEVDHIPLPYVDNFSIDVFKIDELLRDKGIEAVLDIIDQEVLINQLGISPLEVQSAREIWKKLSGRRLRRGKTK